MDDKPIEDSIVVAYRTDIANDEASSESLDEEQYDGENTTVFQDMSSEGPSIVNPNTRETRKSGARTQGQPQLRNEVHDSPDHTDKENPKDTLNALSGVAALKARFNLSPRKSRRSQNTQSSVRYRSTIGEMADLDHDNKRCRDPSGSPGNQRPRKRAPAPSPEEAKDSQGNLSSARQIQPPTFSSPAHTEQSSTPLRMPAEQQQVLNQNETLKSQVQVAELEIADIRAQLQDHISSRAELKKKITTLVQKLNQKREGTEPERQAYQRAGSEIEEMIKTDPDQIPNLSQQPVQNRGATLKNAERIRRLEDQVSVLKLKLQRRQAAIELYMSSNTDLGQRIKDLESQLREMNASTDASAKALRAEVDEKEATIQRMTEHAEDVQDELDWYKNQLTKERGLFEADWANREREIRSLMMDVLGHMGTALNGA
ncbi:hypothetical protein VPNG_08509 [Cytospora leucostoma]|uniref:Uncharacterized protein n=1 Tax=Cytospora leucostoma TaxID=1230097 RepID=A0A423W508_9PEZI|nr:hypothetical protein VPNG_08509 [Cytospora leucostoma]